MTDTAPNPEPADTGAEETITPPSTRPANADGMTLEGFSTQALREHLAEGGEELFSISIRAELAWRDAQEFDLAEDVDTFALLLKLRGFTEFGTSVNRPYVEHVKSGVSIRPTEEAFVICYPAPFLDNGSVARLAISRATPHHVVAETAYALHYWREHAFS